VKPANEKKVRRVAKSAKSGRFVSAKFAKEHPATTFWQRIKRWFRR
jgi:hypothetical protein